jgi:hypothetical protein
VSFGDVVLARSSNEFIASAIEWFTNSDLSHSLVTMPDLMGYPMCMEAVAGGVDMARFDTNYADNASESYQVWQVNVPDSVKEAALKSILDDLETRYGFLSYPWFIWRALNRLLGRDIKAQDNWNTTGMICTQVCAAYLTACGLSSVLAGYGKGSLCPQDLQDIFKAHPDLFTLVGTKGNI